MRIKLFIFLILFLANFASAAESWIGKYTYSENIDADKFMFLLYEVNVYSENSKLRAEVNVNGFQTNVHLKCNLLVNGNSVRFVVSEIGSENLYSPFSIGEPLFEFRKFESNLITHWLNMKPLKPENQKVGSYFEIVKDL